MLTHHNRKTAHLSPDPPVALLGESVCSEEVRGGGYVEEDGKGRPDEVGGNVPLFHTIQGMKMLYLFALKLRSSMMQGQHTRVNEIHALHSIAYAVAHMTQ